MSDPATASRPAIKDRWFVQCRKGADREFNLEESEYAKARRKNLFVAAWRRTADA